MKLYILLFFFTGVISQVLHSQYLNQEDRKVYIDTNYKELYTGELISNYETGQVKNKWNYVNGIIDGESVLYYENGQVMMEGNWANGQEAGVVKEYYENGDIKSEKAFNSGAIDVAKTKTFEPKKPIVVRAPEEKLEPPPIIGQKTEKDNLGKVFNGEGYWKLYNNGKEVNVLTNFSRSYHAILVCLRFFPIGRL